MATARKTAARKSAAGGTATQARAVQPGPRQDGQAARPSRAAKGDKADKAGKPAKIKLVRDSFTIPKAEYAVLEALKQRAAKLGRPAKKSEVLRAGVKALAAMPDAAFLASVGDVPAVKTGRPAKA